MKSKYQYLNNIQFYILILLLFTGMSTAEAAFFTNNNCQPMFFHDLDNPDGSCYVTPNWQCIKLRIVDNHNGGLHACYLIAQSGVRNRREYPHYQQQKIYVQCRCQRGVSEGSAMCVTF